MDKSGPAVTSAGGLLAPPRSQPTGGVLAQTASKGGASEHETFQGISEDRAPKGTTDIFNTKHLGGEEKPTTPPPTPASSMTLPHQVVGNDPSAAFSFKPSPPSKKASEPYKGPTGAASPTAAPSTASSQGAKGVTFAATGADSGAESASKQAAKASDEVRKMEDTHNFKPVEEEWKKGAPAGTQTPATQTPAIQTPVIQNPQPPQTPVRAGGPTGGPLTKGLEAAEDKGAKSVAKETFGKPEMAGTIGSPSGEGAKKASGTVADDAAGKAGLAGAAGVAGAGGASSVVHKDVKPDVKAVQDVKPAEKVGAVQEPSTPAPEEAAKSPRSAAEALAPLTEGGLADVASAKISQAYETAASYLPGQGSQVGPVVTEGSSISKEGAKEGAPKTTMGAISDAATGAAASVSAAASSAVAALSDMIPDETKEADKVGDKSALAQQREAGDEWNQQEKIGEEAAEGMMQSVGTGVEQAKQAAHKGYVTMVGAAEVVGDSLKKSPQAVKDFSQATVAQSKEILHDLGPRTRAAVAVAGEKAVVVKDVSIEKASELGKSVWRSVPKTREELNSVWAVRMAVALFLMLLAVGRVGLSLGNSITIVIGTFVAAVVTELFMGGKTPGPIKASTTDKLETGVPAQYTLATTQETTAPVTKSATKSAESSEISEQVPLTSEFGAAGIVTPKQAAVLSGEVKSAFAQKGPSAIEE